MEKKILIIVCLILTSNMYSMESNFGYQTPERNHSISCVSVKEDHRGAKRRRPIDLEVAHVLRRVLFPDSPRRTTSDNRQTKRQRNNRTARSDDQSELYADL